MELTPLPAAMSPHTSSDQEPGKVLQHINTATSIINATSVPGLVATTPVSDSVFISPSVPSVVRKAQNTEYLATTTSSVNTAVDTAVDTDDANGREEGREEIKQLADYHRFDTNDILSLQPQPQPQPQQRQQPQPQPQQRQQQRQQGELTPPLGPSPSPPSNHNFALWSTEKVGLWLSSLGQAYARIVPKFIEFGVSGDLLTELDDTLLKDGLEISNPLMRRKILKEITKLTTTTTTDSKKQQQHQQQQQFDLEGSHILPPSAHQHRVSVEIGDTNTQPQQQQHNSDTSASDYSDYPQPHYKDLERALTPTTTHQHHQQQQQHQYIEYTLGGQALTTLVPFQEIPFRDLEIECKIGEGAYGAAHIAKWRGSKVVVKRMHKVLETGDMKAFFNEIRLMEKVGRHPCVISLVGACLTPPDVCLVTEYAERGSIYDVIIKNNELSEPQHVHLLVRMAVDASAGILHLHSEGVVHRDIACRNILLDSEYRARVCDFGRSKDIESKTISAKSKTIIGPVKWMAPESLRYKDHNFKSDVYMFGITLWELFARQTPYPDLNNLDAAFGVVGKQQLRPLVMSKEECPKGISRLMQECWAENPIDRPTMMEVNQRLRYILRTQETHPLEVLVMKSPTKTTQLKDKVKETTLAARERITMGLQNLNTFFIHMTSCVSSQQHSYSDSD